MIKNAMNARKLLQKRQQEGSGEADAPNHDTSPIKSDIPFVGRVTYSGKFWVSGACSAGAIYCPTSNNKNCSGSTKCYAFMQTKPL